MSAWASSRAGLPEGRYAFCPVMGLVEDRIALAPATLARHAREPPGSTASKVFAEPGCQ